MISILWYVVMVHPFGGYFDNYLAWMDWGGLQSSDFRSVRYLVPCLGLLFVFVVMGRQLIGDAPDDDRREGPPYPGFTS